MRRLVGTLLLLLFQFGPLAGAVLCMHAAAQPEADCGMPMPGMPHENGRPHSSPTQDCAQMAVCGPAVPMVPVAVRELAVTRPSPVAFSTPASLLPGDPITPPQPPPIV